MNGLWDVNGSPPLREHLRAAGIGSVVFGAIAIATGFASLDIHALNGLASVIGLFLLVEGVWLILVQRRVGLLIDGIALCVLGLWNSFAVEWNRLMVEMSGGAGVRGVFYPLAILQMLWGFDSFRRYRRTPRDVMLPTTPEANRLLVFFGVVYGLTWLMAIPGLFEFYDSAGARHLRPWLFEAPRFVQELALWSARLESAYVVWVIPLFPALTAIGLAWLDDRKRGAVELLAPLTRWRIGARWGAATLLLPIAIHIAVVGTLAARHKVWPVFDFHSICLLFASPWFYTSTLSAGLAYVGWIGYVLPRLRVERTPLGAVLLLGLLIWVCGVPGRATALSTNEDTLKVIWWIIVPLVAAVSSTIVLCWLHGGTEGNLLSVVLFVAVLAGISQLVRLPQGVSASLGDWSLVAAVKLVPAIAVLVWGRQCLMRVPVASRSAVPVSDDPRLGVCR